MRLEYSRIFGFFKKNKKGIDCLSTVWGGCREQPLRYIEVILNLML